MKANTELSCTCPNCGKEAILHTSDMITVYPPRYRVHCQHCEYQGYINAGMKYYSEKTDDCKQLAHMKDLESLEVKLKYLEKRLAEVEGQLAEYATEFTKKEQSDE